MINLLDVCMCTYNKMHEFLHLKHQLSGVILPCIGFYCIASYSAVIVIYLFASIVIAVIVSHLNTCWRTFIVLIIHTFCISHICMQLIYSFIFTFIYWNYCSCTQIQDLYVAMTVFVIHWFYCFCVCMCVSLVCCFC